MIARIVVSLGLVFGVAFFGRMAIGQPAEHAQLRFAWRTSGSKVRICGEQTQAQKEKIPIHMRRDAGCVNRILAYRLRIKIDGAMLEDRLVVPPGIHGDRPLVVQEEYALTPGEKAVEVTFSPEVDNQLAAAKGDAKRVWNEAAEKAPKYALVSKIALERGRAAVIEIDKHTGQLAVHR